MCSFVYLCARIKFTFENVLYYLFDNNFSLRFIFSYGEQQRLSVWSDELENRCAGTATLRLVEKIKDQKYFTDPVERNTDW